MEKTCKIVSIKRIGKAKCLDLEMKSKYHNFVCEGLVTSNSHSTSYALITYSTAWLKTFYPKEFMVALMSHNSDNDKMMPRYFSECGRLKLKFGSLNVNKSEDKFLLTKKGKIISPLTLIKSFGEKAYEVIFKERKENGFFESFEDFYDRIDKRVLNVRIVGNMILAGCFKSIENSISETFDKYIEKRGKDKIARQFYCEGCKFRYPCSIDLDKSEDKDIICPNCNSHTLHFSDSTCRGKEFNLNFLSTQVFGFAMIENPLKKYVKQIEEVNADSLDILAEVEENQPVGVAIFVKRIKKYIDKKGNEMAFIGISDGNIDCDLTIFSSDWEELNDRFHVGNCYLLVAFKNRGNNLLYNSRSRPKSKIIPLGA